MPAALPAIKVAFAATAKYLAAHALLKTILINVALGAISRKLAQRRQTVPPLNVTVRGTVENRRLVFGTRRVGGVMVFYDVSSSGGSTNDKLWYVVVLAGHQVDSIGDVWLDTRRIPAADIDPTTGEVDGSVFSFQKVYIWKYLGTQAQTVHSELDSIFSEWTSDHRLRGCAYLVVCMHRDDGYFPSGAPQSVTALVDGARCYDSRKDSTNGGSGSHRRDNPSTWEFTRNPALQLRWYLTGGSVVNDQSSRLVRYGLREPDDRISDAYVAAAANICDESISGGNAPPSGAQPRYRCDMEVSCGETRRDIVEAILTTMAGTLTNEHGKWRMFAGAYDSPTHSLTQDDLYGPIESQDAAPHSERYNAVSATYVDAAKQYVEQTTPFRTDEDYEEQDGDEQIPREIDLRGVTDIYQAQRLAEIELRKSRMMRVIKIVGGLNLLKIAKNETFTLSHARYGWVNRVFRCVERQFEFNEDAGRVTITARREDAGVYTDMLTADYTAGTSDTDVFTYELPDAPTSLTATAYPTIIVFTVGLPDVLQSGSVVELWEYSASTPFASSVKVKESRDSVILLPKRDNTTRYYWATVKNVRGVRSVEYPSGGGVAAQADFVQTEDIAEDAATIVYSESLVGPDTTAIVVGTFIDITVPEQPIDHLVVATVVGDFYKSDSGTGMNVSILQTQDGSSGISSNVAWVLTTSSDGQRLTLRHTFSASANEEYDYALRFNTNAIGKTITLKNAILQVEVIKR